MEGAGLSGEALVECMRVFHFGSADLEKPEKTAPENLRALVKITNNLLDHFERNKSIRAAMDVASNSIGELAREKNLVRFSSNQKLDTFKRALAAALAHCFTEIQWFLCALDCCCCCCCWFSNYFLFIFIFFLFVFIF